MFCELCGVEETSRGQRECKSCGNEFSARSMAYVYSPIITTPASIVIFWAVIFWYIEVKPEPWFVYFLFIGGTVYGISNTIKRWRKSRQ